MQIPFELLAIIQFSWIIAALVWFLWRNDEIPIIATLIVFYYGSFRYFAVLQGWGAWCSMTNFGYSSITNEAALHALFLMVLGESILIATYFYFQKRPFTPVRSQITRDICERVLGPLWLFSLLGVAMLFGVRYYLSHQGSMGNGNAYDVGAYFYLLPLLLISAAFILMILVRFGRISTGSRLFSIAVLITILATSFETQGRFKFLALLIIGVLLFTASYRSWQRLGLMFAGMAFAAAALALAGSQRNERGTAERGQILDHFRKAEDVNMIDGFVFLLEVVPSRLPYRFGGGHMGILYRPIPRALWPDKPVDDYMLKAIGLDAKSGFTIGISPSLFGDFYMEGGVIGLVLLSIGYGTLLARISRWAAGLHAFGGLAIRGMICSSFALMLRGGDLPGVYAWLAMSYWPMLLVLLSPRGYLKKNSPWFVNPVRRPLRKQLRQSRHIPSDMPA